MPTQRKRLSRAESQQQTREEVLDAAEELFLAHGLHSTTVAKIAAAAGRTQGAIYANFTSKENLCAEVLLRCYMRTFAGLFSRFAQSADPVDQQIESLVDWWKTLAAEENLLALAGEYALAIHKDPDQLAVSHGHIDIGRTMLGTMMSSALPGGRSEHRDRALDAIMATAIGLACGRTLGVFDDDRVAELLTATLRLWGAELQRP